MANDKSLKQPGPEESTKLLRISVPAEQGEFAHQAEEAESPCVTGRPAPWCGCGRYELEWAPTVNQAP